MTKKQSEEYENRTIPNLELRGIGENETLEENVVVRQFVNNNSVKVSGYIERIRALFAKIENIKVETDVFPIKNQLLITKKAEINDGVVRLIRSVAEQMNIELSEHNRDNRGY